MISKDKVNKYISGGIFKKIFGSISKIRELGVFIGFVGLFIIFSLATPVFFTLNNVINIIRQVSLLGILSMGMTMVIGSGEIDLSVGSIYGMSAMLAGLLMTSGMPIWISVICGIIAGIVAGTTNGVLITYARVPSLIVTLGMLNIARGFALLLTKGVVITLSPITVKDPRLDAFTFIGRGKIFTIIPTMTIAFIVIALIAYVIYHINIIGFRMKAVGGNPDAARVSGINVQVFKIIAFSIMGLLSAIGGIINFAFLNL